MSESLVQTFPSAPVLAERPEQVIARIKEARALVVEIQRELMKPGVHYGVLPGTEKPALLKEGAEILNQAFRLSAREEEVQDLSGADERKYKVTLGLYDGAGRRLGFGVGVCSTSEEKYHWRKAWKSDYEAAPVDRRRTKQYPKREGGGFDTVYQVRIEPADVENTVLQMATKRAYVQATRQVHAVSDVFSDITLEDLPDEVREALMLGGRKKPQVPRAKSSGGAGGQTNGAPPDREPGGDDAAAGPAPIIPAEAWQPVKEAWHDRGTISAAQQKRLFAIAFSRQWSGDEIVAELRAGLQIKKDESGNFPIPAGKPYELVVGIFDHPRNPAAAEDKPKAGEQ